MVWVNGKDGFTTQIYAKIGEGRPRRILGVKHILNKIERITYSSISENLIGSN